MSESATATAAATAGANVPVTATGRIAPGTNINSALIIGTNRLYFYNLNNNNDTSAFWLVVVDLTNLNVVANVQGDGKNVPPAVQGYVNNPRYFLFCIGNCLQGWQIPYGAFYTFLQQVGSGPRLAYVEQVYHQLSSGMVQNYCYTLAATMDNADYHGFEASSFTNATILAMQFMPMTIGGQTIYSPINPFAG